MKPSVLSTHCRQKLSLAASAVMLCTGLAHASSFHFAPYQTHQVGNGTRPNSIAVGDLTGDGRDDIVVATTFYFDPDNDYHVHIYRQTPAGNLTFSRKLFYGEASGNATVAMGDFNKDGWGDIAVADFGIHIFINDRMGGFIGSHITQNEFDPNYFYIRIADMNNDGNPDLVAQSWSEGAAMYKGQGNGQFQQRIPLANAAEGYNDIQLGDLNGDSYTDIALVSNQGTPPHFYTYPRTNAGFVETPHDVPDPGAWGLSSVAIGDFNYDGRNDAVVGVSANGQSSRIWLYKQDASGTLSTPTSQPVSEPLAELLSIDLDLDGKTDLVSKSGEGIGRFMQGRTGLQAEILQSLPFDNPHPPHRMQSGDLNGDGCTDLALANNGGYGLVVVPGSNCYEPWRMSNQYAGDFDGDGESDILWHNTATGQGMIWRGGDNSARMIVGRLVDTRWNVAGVGDFTGDGRADILWHHATTRANMIWPSADAAHSIVLLKMPRPWEVAGVGDFDGNGADDILWRQPYSGGNVIWREGQASQIRAVAALGSGYRVAGVGNFDGDQQDDILWRHRDYGFNLIWRNANSTLSRSLTSRKDLQWQVASLGDFNMDGRADILWRNAFDGNVQIWPSGLSAQNRNLTGITDLTWKIAGVGDYDADGLSDILWRRQNTGVNAIWPGGDYASRINITGVYNMQWRVAR